MDYILTFTEKGRGTGSLHGDKVSSCCAAVQSSLWMGLLGSDGGGGILNQTDKYQDISRKDSDLWLHLKK